MMTITGFSDVRRMLAAIGGARQREASRRALKLAAQPVRAAAQAIIPLGGGRSTWGWSKGARKQKTWHLRNNIAIAMGGSRGGKLRVHVRQRGGEFQGETFYGSFVELGHRIGKRSSTIRRAQRTRNQAVLATDTRKQVAGRWYMRKAGQCSEQQAIDIYETELTRWLNQEAQ